MIHDLEIETARVFQLFGRPSRYKAAHGGRGSAKSHDAAQRLVKRCVKNRNTRWLCARQVQKSLNESAKRLIEDKIEALSAPGFRVLNDRIITPGDGSGVIVFHGLQDQTVESIKSFEGFDGAWVEEAHTITEKALKLIRPTIRKAGSEIWFTWNPRRKSDPVDAFFRGKNPPPDSIVIESNWRDNPWFPDVLQAERQYDEAYAPDYEHVWEGAYATVVKGAYFAEGLAKAQREGRICRLSIDPMAQIRAVCDIGGAGARADAMAIWIVQHVGKEIWFLDYIEGQGQVLGYYANELRERGYEGALIVLPHDGNNANNVTGWTYEQHWQDAGFKTKVIENQGMGAAMVRVHALRRLMPRCWFDSEKTLPGREALGAYHAKRDDNRDVDLGPEHDWSSHAADAAGLEAITYEEPKANIERRPAFTRQASAEMATAWMGS